MREHVIADLSVNHVERQALLCGYSIERLVHDYGIDLVVFTFNRKGEVEEGKILLQVKATDHLKASGRKTTFSFRIERSNLVSWLAQTLPVILVVYDARKEVAYWLYVQSCFARREGFNLFTAGKTVTVHIPTRNVVDPGAMKRFARFRDRLLDQMRELIHDEE